MAGARLIRPWLVPVKVKGPAFGAVTRPGVRFGKPLDFSRYEGMEGDRFVLRSITDEIMYEIMRLSGQEYVDLYAAKAKELSQKSAAEARRSTRHGRQTAGSSCTPGFAVIRAGG